MPKDLVGIADFADGKLRSLEVGEDHLRFALDDIHQELLNNDVYLKENSLNSVVEGDGIEVDITDPLNPIVAVDLAANPGLEFSGGDLRVKPFLALFRDGNGLNVDMGTLSTQAAAGDDARFHSNANDPTGDQKEAMNAASSPSGANPFLTDSDQLALSDLAVASVPYVASAQENYSIPVLKNVNHILLQKIFINDGLATPFLDDLIISYYTRGTRLGEDALFRAEEKMVRVAMDGNTLATDLAIPVVDETDFAANDLIWIGGASPEFLRLSGISAGQLDLESGAKFAHTSGDPVSRVIEIGSLTLESITSLNIYGRAEWLSGAQTTTLKVNTRVWS